MRVGSQLEEAQLEQITTAEEATAGKESGRTYFNPETFEILIGDGTGLKRFATTQASIGDVKHSMLTEAQFQAEVDDTWIVADGRDVTGSDYAALTGSTLAPDMRGIFLRGVNNGGSALGTRSDGNENPAGSLIGDYEADDFKSHKHTFPIAIAEQPVITQTYDGNSGPTPDATGSTSFEGGAETRTKNITVNIFIKINRAV